LMTTFLIVEPPEDPLKNTSQQSEASILVG